ncbi:MAG: metal-dependent transcriptional regulator [Actinobacteria bacterium]|nr:MAG: metal-dependent transcriptional regulator [Actinomycetota bacterium]
MASPVVEEYLEAIYKLQADGKSLGTSELGKELGVSPASATEMAKRLSEKGLVARDDKRGITLTKKGEKAALELIRKHRISERFLVDILGMEWQDAHEEACKFEHVISPEVESRMEALLDNPSTCPHGHPIPDRQGKTATERIRRLSTLKRRQSGVIAKIAEERRELLEYLATLGLMPDRKVRVEQIAPFEGPMLIQVNGASYALGREIAEKIWVRER